MNVSPLRGSTIASTWPTGALSHLPLIRFFTSCTFEALKAHGSTDAKDFHALRRIAVVWNDLLIILIDYFCETHLY